MIGEYSVISDHKVTMKKELLILLKLFSSCSKILGTVIFSLLAAFVFPLGYFKHYSYELVGLALNPSSATGQVSLLNLLSVCFPLYIVGLMISTYLTGLL